MDNKPNGSNGIGIGVQIDATPGTPGNCIGIYWNPSWNLGGMQSQKFFFDFYFSPNWLSRCWFASLPGTLKAAASLCMFKGMHITIQVCLLQPLSWSRNQTRSLLSWSSFWCPILLFRLMLPQKASCGQQIKGTLWTAEVHDIKEVQSYKQWSRTCLLLLCRGSIHRKQNKEKGSSPKNVSSLIVLCRGLFSTHDKMVFSKIWG